MRRHSPGLVLFGLVLVLVSVLFGQIGVLTPAAAALEDVGLDHGVVRSGGRVIGRDGNPISGLIRENYEMAHIPLDEWFTWSTWNAP